MSEQSEQLTIGKMVDILTSGMEQTRIGEYIEEVITYPLYKKRKYTFRQMLEAEIKANEEIERHLEYMRSNPYARK